MAEENGEWGVSDIVREGVEGETLDDEDETLSDFLWLR